MLGSLLKKLKVQAYNYKTRDGKLELYLRRDGQPEEKLEKADVESLRWECVLELEKAKINDPGSPKDGRFAAMLKLVARSNVREAEEPVAPKDGRDVFTEFVHKIVDGEEGAPDGVIGKAKIADNLYSVTLLPMLPSKLAELVRSTMGPRDGDAFASGMRGTMERLGFRHVSLHSLKGARGWEVSDAPINIGLPPGYLWRSRKEQQSATEKKIGEAKKSEGQK